MQSSSVRGSGSPFGVPWWALVAAAFVYVVSPIDLLPEFPLGCIGLVDDLGAVGFGLYSFVQMLRGGPRQSPAATSAFADARPVVVEPVEVRSSPSPAVPVLPVRSSAPPSRPHETATAVFVVQLVDDAGAEHGVEVTAHDADGARASVAALGADGRIGKVFLKRLLSPPSATGFGELV